MFLLEQFGYKVVSVPSSVQALKALESYPDIALLFTDIVMPNDINGYDLAYVARRSRPDLPILFASGYTEHGILLKGDLSRNAALISKPYLREELARKLRGLLEGGQAVPLI